MENEARERLSSIELIGELKEWSDEEVAQMRGPDPMEMMEAQAEVDIEKAKRMPKENPPDAQPKSKSSPAKKS